jgi:AAA+ superfamily predicted ATPase
MIAETDTETVFEPTAGRRGVESLLARVRLRVQRRVLWMRSQVKQVPEGFTGLAISPAEVDRILEDPVETAAKEEIFYQTDAATRELSEQIRAVDLKFSQDPAWQQLREQFALSDFETDLLSLSVAAGADPFLLRVYAYLQDDAGASYVTPWLAGCLFQKFPLPSLGPESSLAKWHLAHAVDQNSNPWVANAPWVADPHIMLWLLGRASIDPVLGSAVQFLAKEQSIGKLCLYPQQLAEMLHFVQAVSQRTAELTQPAVAIDLEIIGVTGTGKRTLAAQLAAALGAGLITVDADALLASDVAGPVARERVLHAIRMAQLAGAVLYWHGGDRVSARIWQATNGGSGLMLFGSESSSEASKSRATRFSVRLPALRAEVKQALWERLSSLPLPSMVLEWMLTPGEIVKAAQTAPAGENAVIDSCQDSLQLEGSELFTPLVCPFGWDDIVLPSHLREHLAELEQQVRLRSAVYEEWGFEQLCPLGGGITALFSGPSGTGKTMAAQVLARSLGMKLFRVDLSGVMNKYIGETEKRLKQVFDACERANVLLFFDEADALFGQRTQVKDAHDRFANIEIDYLLQRMEQFEGVAVLATNRKGDLDKAFVRRIRFILDFMPPGPEERLALWRRALLPRSPRGEELLDSIDMNFLAQKLSMTGAEITAAALGAAFLARADGGRIAMHHVLHAARREMSKNGAVMRMGEWGN